MIRTPVRRPGWSEPFRRKGRIRDQRQEVFEIARETDRHRIPPCARCPYKLGLVRTLVNPCPQCREDGYAMYDRFLTRGGGDRQRRDGDRE